MQAPWQVLTGIVVLAGSLVPAWLLDLSKAPTESNIRFWTTLLVAIALFGVARRISLFRWLLLVLLGAGVVASVWSFFVASTIEVESALITLVQAAGLALLFAPAANAWFRRKALDDRPDAAV